MSATGYENMLEKYRDVDEDEIMSGLTKDELARLENEIDREILEKPPEYESYGSDAYTTATTTTDDSEPEEADEEPAKPAPVQEETREEIRPRTSSRGKPEAFAKGKLDKTQLKPVQKTLQRQKSGNKHTFKIPALKSTTGAKPDKANPLEDGNSDLKDELFQAVKKRDKRRTRRGNSSGVARRPSLGVSKARRNSKIARYRDGNEHQIDAAVVNRNFVTDEMLKLRPRLRKVDVKEPKLVLPEELHGVSFNRITAGAKRKKEEEEEEDMEEAEPEPEPAISEDGDASRNSAFGYDADNDVTPSDDSYALPGEDCEMEDEIGRRKAMSESSEAPSDGVVTMASTTSTSAESCDVFGELSINPNSVEEMLERVRENDPTLTEVNLNNIHDVPMERFEELAEAMKGNTHVTSLTLANTGLTDRAAKALAAMLKKNKTLKKLNVESNFITGDGGRRLVSALRRNNCLIELSLDNQRHIFGAKVEFEMSKLLRENTSLLKFGYQFANPGPRMATSNILTKNMDLVRKKRVAEEKKRQHAGPAKRPPLRRQPSSEWYRKERLERLKKLQEQSKMLGLDPSKNIGDKEVEKVLKNMNPDEVTLLERWFTSKLLGMVDAPPSAEKGSDTKKEKADSPKRPAKDEKKEDKTKKLAGAKPDDNLLRPPSRSRRSKSPVASRDELMDSIRKQNARLKKVQLRPFESPSRLGNTDSEAEIRSQLKEAPEKILKEEIMSKETKVQGDRSPSEKQTSQQVQNSCDRTRSPIQSMRSNKENPKQVVKTKIATISSNDDVKAQSAMVRPAIVKTEPSFEEPPRDEPPIQNKSPEPSSEEMFTASDAEISGSKSNEAFREDESQQRPSSPEIREWKEGEEYDSDEYEVVEIEVTDSEDEEEKNEDAKTDDPKEEEISQRCASGDPRSHLSPSPLSERERDSTSPNYRSSLSTRLSRNRPPPFSGSKGDSSSPHPAALQRVDAEDVKSPSRYDNKSRSSRVSPKVTASPVTSPRINPRSPLSPPAARSNTFSPPSYNRGLTRDSNASSDSAKSSPRFTRPIPPRSSRPARSKPAEEDVQICPKALSTIESFFAFK